MRPECLCKRDAAEWSAGNCCGVLSPLTLYPVALAQLLKAIRKQRIISNTVNKGVNSRIGIASD
jgi:hypothetical protein